MDFRQSKKQEQMLSPFPSGNILFGGDPDLRKSCLEDSFEKDVELTLVMSIQSVGKPIQILA